MTAQELGYKQKKPEINTGDPVIVTTANSEKLGRYREFNEGVLILDPVYLRNSKGIYVPGEHIEISRFEAIQKITPDRLKEIITNSKPPFLPYENMTVQINTPKIGALGFLSEIRQSKLILSPYIYTNIHQKKVIDYKGVRVVDRRQDIQVTPLEEPLEDIVKKLNKQRVIE